MHGRGRTTAACSFKFYRVIASLVKSLAFMSKHIFLTHVRRVFCCVFPRNARANSVYKNVTLGLRLTWTKIYVLSEQEEITAQLTLRLFVTFALWNRNALTRRVHLFSFLTHVHSTTAVMCRKCIFIYIYIYIPVYAPKHLHARADLETVLITNFPATEQLRICSIYQITSICSMLTDTLTSRFLQPKRLCN